MAGITSYPTQPPASGTSITFAVVKSSDGMKVAAFTPHILQARHLTTCAERALASLPTGRVEDADWMVMPVNETDAMSEVCFGTAVGIRFAAPQSSEVISMAARALADALEGGGFQAQILTP